MILNQRTEGIIITIGMVNQTKRWRQWNHVGLKLQKYIKIQTITKNYQRLNHHQNGTKLSNYYDTVKSPNISPKTVNKFIFFPVKFIRFNFLHNPNFKEIQRKFIFMLKETVHRKRTLLKVALRVNLKFTTVSVHSYMEGCHSLTKIPYFIKIIRLIGANFTSGKVNNIFVLTIQRKIQIQFLPIN